MIHKTVLSGLTATTKKHSSDWVEKQLMSNNKIFERPSENNNYINLATVKSSLTTDQSSCLVCGLWLYLSRFGPLEKKKMLPTPYVESEASAFGSLGQHVHKLISSFETFVISASTH